MASNLQKQLHSFLSENVQELLCRSAVTVPQNEIKNVKSEIESKDGPTATPTFPYHAICSSPFSNINHLIDMDYIHSILPVQLDDPTVEYFAESVGLLSGAMSQSQHILAYLHLDDFQKWFHGCFTWTTQPEIFSECFTLLQEDPESNSIMVMLLLSATLERSLGDVYLVRGKQCPHLFKDLIVTPELTNILGPTYTQLVQIMFGPPISLNLRNLVWHGFPCIGEIHPRFCYFTLLLTASIGHHLLDCDVIDKIVHRKPASFESATKIHLQIAGCTIPDKPTFQHIISLSPFVVAMQEPLWLQAYSFYQQKRYHESVCMLFPLMEHGLRCAFARLNNCPHRIMTAEVGDGYGVASSLSRRISLRRSGVGRYDGFGTMLHRIHPQTERQLILSTGSEEFLKRKHWNKNFPRVFEFTLVKSELSLAFVGQWQ